MLVTLTPPSVASALRGGRKQIGRDIELRAWRLAFVVVPAGGDADFVVGDLVHQAVLVGDATGPVALEAVLEGLGFADSLVAVALDVLDELVDPLEDLAVLG